MTTTTGKKTAAAARRLATERKWFEDHGGTLSAYVARYGAAADPDRYGDGGEAIYAADLAAVKRCEAAAGGGTA